MKNKELNEFKKQCKVLLTYLVKHNHGTLYERGQIDLLNLILKDLR
jgi:hypothetical protein